MVGCDAQFCLLGPLGLTTVAVISLKMSAVVALADTSSVDEVGTHTH